jgi:ABC-2 type transport system permease protein
VRNTATVALKEFKSYLTSPMFYVVGGIFLALTGYFFAYGASAYAQTSIKDFLGAGNILLLLLAGVMTMRLIAEERKMGTLELLLTSPLRDSEVVVGKFLGGLGSLVVLLVLTLYYPILLKIFGDPDVGPFVTGYIGLFLLGAAALAVGLFASSLTSNQVVAVVVSWAILFALWYGGNLADFLPQKLGTTVGYFSFSFYAPDFANGVIDTRGIVYFLSVIVLFLFLSVRSLENSRWS